MQINRLFEIVYLLLDKKCVTANELAERFEVSVRTVYRDIETLSEAGIPVYAERGRGGGIRLTESFVLNKSVLTDREKSDIVAGMQGLVATRATDREALDKLSAFLGTSETEWVAIDFDNWCNSGQQLLTAIKTGILEHKTIIFDYFNSFGEKLRREVEPIQLWFKGNTWYLKAFCLTKNDMRVFKLTRIKNAELTDKFFVPKKPENINFSENMFRRPNTQITLKIDAKMAFRVFDEFGEEDIKKDENGDFIIRCEYPFDTWVIGIVLSYGATCEVLEPIELREKLSEEIIKISEKYNKI